MLRFGLTKLVVAAALVGGFALVSHGDLYVLETCPVSGKALGDKPVVKEVEGREVRFCCGGCPAKYEGDVAKYSAAIDEAIIKEQADSYPLANCPISGKPLGDSPVMKVSNNRLVEFCCNNCASKYEADPAAYTEKLDEAVKAAQAEAYPLKDCIVSGEPLGSMGEPKEIVVANHLVKFCCGGCENKFNASPATYLSKLEPSEEKSE